VVVQFSNDLRLVCLLRDIEYMERLDKRKYDFFVVFKLIWIFTKILEIKDEILLLRRDLRRIGIIILFFKC